MRCAVLRIVSGVVTCAYLVLGGCSTDGGSNTREDQWRDAESQGVVWVDDELAEGVGNLPASLPYGTYISTDGAADPFSALGCRYIFIVGEPPYQDEHGIYKEIRSKTTVRVPDRIDNKHVWQFRTVGCEPWTVVERPSATPAPAQTPTRTLGVSPSEFETAFDRIGSTSITASEWHGFSFSLDTASHVPCAGVSFAAGGLVESASLYYSTEELPLTGEGCDATISLYMVVLSSVLEPDNERRGSDLFKAMVTIYCQRDLAACRKGGFDDVSRLTDIFPNDSRGTTIRRNGYFVTGFDVPSVSQAGIDIVQAD